MRLIFENAKDARAVALKSAVACAVAATAWACAGSSSPSASGPLISAADAGLATFVADVAKGDSKNGAKDSSAAADGAMPSTGAADTAGGGAVTTDDSGSEGARGYSGGDSDPAARSVDSGPVCEPGKFCQTDADCPVTQCAIGECKGGCCVVAPAKDGSTCNDGNACTSADSCAKGVCAGKAKNCDDGKDCTSDGCDAKAGKCFHEIAEKYCLISGKCVAEGEKSQSSICKSCDPAQATDAWTVAANCCANDTECPAGGVCDKPVCDPNLHTCGFAKVTGCCTQDSECDDSNACTKDVCDVTAGTCAYTAVNCVDPNPCQAATCESKTGQCVAATKPGWCLVDGACQPEGAQNPANPCFVCSSVQSDKQWTAAAGSACNDSNPCTFGDTCTAAGQCAGKPQQGCCQSNADCAPSGDPCAANVCDLKVGLCIAKTVAGCCTSGTCCNAATNTVKAAKSPCGGGPIAIEYQCSGQVIQSREISPGCDGNGPTGCSTQAPYLVAGPWQNMQTCGAGTACTPAGSGQKPTCQSTQPAGSCANSCGSKSATGACYCDSICTVAGDCCKDFMALCGCASGECCDVANKFPKAAGTACGAAKTEFQCNNKAVQKRTGMPTCDGKNVCSSAATDIKWGTWSTTQTCASGQNCLVPADASTGSCVAAPAGSCVGHCGAKSTASCYCDSVCKALGDCCGDFDTVGCAGVQTCGAKAATSCKGVCGSQSAGLCWCDTLCDSIGDCCADKAVCGCK